MEPPALIDPAAVARQLALRGRDCRVEFVASTGSTNSDLVARCRTARPLRPVLRATAHQSAGRGRLGRPWLAAPGSALLFSIAVPLDAPPAAVPAVTLACGVALAEACRERGVAVAIKWPNDVWLDGRKLAGVLSELAVDDHGGRSLIVGVGINLALDAATRAEIDAPAAALADALPGQPVAGDWLAAFAAALLAAIDQYLKTGLAPFAARWAGLDAMKDCKVLVRLGDAVIARGIARGIDAYGRLLIDDAGTLTAISAGDVSLRAAG
ncbi:MAG: biotin--[acetyl-CoA-carboxylase] ligase [Burkholderiaceae bacterium]